MSVIDPRTLNRNDKEDGAEQNSNAQQLSSSAPLTSRTTPFTTGTAPQQGSGRFTNLQKYINANQGAGENLATRINNQTNRDYDTFNTQLGEKNQAVQSGIDMGNDVISNQGDQYKNLFNTWNQGLNSFQTMDNRGNFDQTGQDIQAFTQNPQFADFQKLQSGQAIDQASLQSTQDQAKLMSDAMLKQIQAKNNNIQTEQGRYDLLRQAQPKFGNYNLGQGKLDQLMFQTNPQAISNLQSNFGNQLADVQAKNTALGNQGTNLTNLAKNETSLIDALNSQAQANQNTFNSRLGGVDNLAAVNNARTGLYNDYVNQLQTGQYSQDLAQMLGLNNLNTYNPTNPSGAQFDQGNVISKVGSGVPAPSFTSPNMINDNQFRLYNIMNNLEKDGQGKPIVDPFLQRGAEARTLQDVMLQPDYNTYNALKNISGFDTMAANGVSNLNPAVSQGQNLAGMVQDADANFRNNYLNKMYDSISAAERSYNAGDAFNSSTGHDRNDIANVTGGGNQPLMDLSNPTWQIPTTSTGGAVGLGYAGSNLNDYLYNPDRPLTTATTLRDSGDREANNAAMTAAQGQAQRNAMTLLNNAVTSSGVKNVGTIDPTENLLESKYKRFKGLV